MAKIKKVTKIKDRKVKRALRKKDGRFVCRHDYKNAIQVGNVDYQCPLCDKLLDPLEWFFMNSFTFVDVGVVKNK